MVYKSDWRRINDEHGMDYIAVRNDFGLEFFILNSLWTTRFSCLYLENFDDWMNAFIVI